MPYTPTHWVSGSTPCDAPELNNLEQQYLEATNSFEQDLFATSGFVWSGLVPTPTSGAPYLTVTKGVAYVPQSDGTLRRRVLAQSTQTTSLASTTYYLFLNSDGTWTWGTTSTGPTNSLAICSVTTDGSGNISSVTDKRPLLAPLLGNMDAATRSFSLPAPLQVRSSVNPALAGVVTGGVFYGQFGAIADSPDTSAYFDGASGYISVASPSSLATGNGAWALEAWVYLPANPVTTAACVAGIGTSGTSKSTAQLQIQTSGAPTLNVSGASITGASALSLNTWHHLVGTYDGTTLRLYVDGVSVGSATPGALTLTGAFATIGVYPNTAPTVFFKGWMDEVAFYNANLSSGQVSSHYSAGTNAGADTYKSTILGDGPARFYRLGDAGGSTSAACTVSPMTVASIDASGKATLNSLATIPAVNGQATAGSFGVPVIVAQALNVAVTDTASHTIVSFAAPSDGLYRCNLFVSWSNTGNSDLSAGVQWTDPNLGTPTAFFTAYGNGVLMNGSNIFQGPATSSLATAPLVIYAKGGTTVSIFFHDPSGAPSDHVSAFIERIS